jgi:hypothetical protein
VEAEQLVAVGGGARGDDGAAACAHGVAVGLEARHGAGGVVHLEDAVDVADVVGPVPLLPARLEDDLHDVATRVLRTKLRHCKLIANPVNMSLTTAHACEFDTASAGMAFRALHLMQPMA